MKLYVAVFIFLAVYAPIFPELWESWMEHSNNSHGVLVPIISLYLIWMNKDKLERTDKSSSFIGLVVVVFSLILYLVSLSGGIVFVSRIMMVVTLIGIVLYLYGLERFKIVAFPVCFLVFMVPVPYSIISLVSLPLQTFATTVSANLISMVHIPVVQEGNMLYFVQTQLEVAEACSGIRSIVALTMLSCLFVYLSNSGRWQKLIILLSAIPVALIANILRVTGTGILAHFYGERVARGFLHEFSGMAVFAFGLVVLYVEFKVLNRLFARQRE